MIAHSSSNRNLKENVRYLYDPNWQTEYPVSESVIQDYRDDKNRRGVDLINEFKNKKKNTDVKCGGEAQRFANREDIDFLAPCYFVLENNQVQAFGHGRWFRIPYRKSVGDRIDDRLEDENIVDFTDAVFGRKALWAGRVSFEDAQLQSAPAYACKDYVIPLMKANPTSYQLYLKQSRQLPAHWDSPAAGEVRGYKMYWHQQIGNNDWRTPYSEGLEQHTHEIHPLVKNNVFTGKIHFRNLTAIELGALLKVFQLGNDNQDIVYKLGLGKSLGMGSVRIQAKLSLDSGGRYTALFDKDTWKTSEDVADTTLFLKAFADYVSSCFEKDKKIYQEYKKSLDTLALMLDWNHTKLSNWNERVATMCEGVNQGSISGGVDERFKLRSILPIAEDVVKGKK